MAKRAGARRPGKYSSSEIHEALFPQPPKKRSLAELGGGIATYVKRRRDPAKQELSSLIETVQLLRSPANARRLLSALRRALGRKGS